MNIEIEHDGENHRFFAIIEGKTAKLDYRVSPDGKTLDFVYTYVPPELRGRQIAGQIVKVALDYAKEKKLRVIPTCSFVYSYIANHPEYKDVVVREV